MREDFAKVITERERRGSVGRKYDRKGYRKRLVKEGLDAVKHESIKARGLDDKNLTDVLGPIYGFLDKSVGRRWDDVFSEISERLPASAGVSLSHARDHLLREVELNTKRIDGKVCNSKNEPIPADSWSRHEYYVSPEGILCKIKTKKYINRLPKQKRFQKLPTGEWLIFDEWHTHQWYACTMAPYEKTGERRPVYLSYGLKEGREPSPYKFVDVYPVVHDVLMKMNIKEPHKLGGSGWFPGAYGAHVYCVAKRQLNKTEIRRYGLREG